MGGNLRRPCALPYSACDSAHFISPPPPAVITSSTRRDEARQRRERDRTYPSRRNDNEFLLCIATQR